MSRGAKERGNAISDLLNAAVEWTDASRTEAWKGARDAREELRKAALEYARALGWTPPKENK
jgi:hypothetical protein